VLDLARADLASGAYGDARARAEALLRGRPSADLRAAALAVAGDAAYGMGAYPAAAGHYGEILLADEVPAEAAHATLGLGWAELRMGRREAARGTWLRLSRQFPTDPRAPVALLMAAELAVQAGDVLVGRKLLDRVVESYPAGVEAEVARLSRSVLAMREGRTQRATDDLRILVSSGHSAVPGERKRILDGLAGVEARGGPEGRLVLTLTAGSGGSTTARGEDSRDPERGARSPAGERLEQFAAALLDGARDPETTPSVLHGLILVAAADGAWPQVQALSRHLVDGFAGYPAVPEVLVGVAGRAVAEQQWPIARASYELATARYRAALAPKARVEFAEALLRTGAAAEARGELTGLVESAPRAAEVPRALYLLAEAHEALDEPREALATYEELGRRYPTAEWTAASQLPHARLLQYAIGRQKEARALLEKIVQRARGEERVEASFRLGEVLAADGDHERAMDWYMAAAYGTEQPSRWHRAALVGAGRSLVALRRPRAARAMYRSVLPPTPAGGMPRDGRPAPEIVEAVDEPELAAEAAYAVGELERGAGRNAQALEMYLVAASLVPDSPWRGRALVGAMRSLIAIGDRASAEGIYRELVESGAEEPILGQARGILKVPGRDASGRRH
jgi:TolA-binding protein